MPNQDGILTYDSFQERVECSFNRVADLIQHLFGDSAELGVIVDDIDGRLEELVEQELSFEVEDGGPGEFEATLGDDHFAIDDEDCIFPWLLVLGVELMEILVDW